MQIGRLLVSKKELKTLGIPYFSTSCGSSAGNQLLSPHADIWGLPKPQRDGYLPFSEHQLRIVPRDHRPKSPDKRGHTVFDKGTNLQSGAAPDPAPLNLSPPSVAGPTSPKRSYREAVLCMRAERKARIWPISTVRSLTGVGKDDDTIFAYSGPTR
jgi:hypothetical protein